ncbi:hypothetical protein [Legionella cardiaca]|uniref:Uncharacterized protein n=1 Tax=Legionella cardiaca TaxID=1071983 RepID=A0ABY8ARL3_9GAMM|nr:hypothetical protein [Legionella cardiaca]WED41797.1 hypothetical protein PXX05_07580 [Legionella cardiaca]
MYIPKESQVTISRDLGLKVIAFKKIYWALYVAQKNDSRLKKNFLEDKENLNLVELLSEIEKHYKEKSNSRTRKAWDLAEIFYDNCFTENFDLFVEIYNYAWERTRFKLFSPLMKPLVFSRKNFAEEKDRNWQGMVAAISYELDAGVHLNKHDIQFFIDHKISSEFKKSI